MIQASGKPAIDHARTIGIVIARCPVMHTYSNLVSLILCNVDVSADLDRLSEDYSVSPMPYSVR